MARESYSKLRRKVLEASLRVFSKKGFHSSTMEEIAREAGCSVGMIYKLFSGKEELYRELMVGKATEFHREIMSSLSLPLDPVARLRRTMESKVSVVLRNRDFVRLYMAETVGVPFDIRLGMVEEVRKLYNRFLISLSDLFRQGREEGLFRPYDPWRMAVSVDAMVNAMLMDHLESGGDVDLDGVLSIFLEGVLQDRGS